MADTFSDQPAFAALPPIDGPEGRGKLALDRFIDTQSKTLSPEQLALPTRVQEIMAGLFAGSPFLASIAQRHPILFLDCFEADPEALFKQALTDCSSEAAKATSIKDIMAVLRRAKRKMSMIIAIADLTGSWSVEHVIIHLSLAAEWLLQLAIRFLLIKAAHAGQIALKNMADPECGSGLIILGMGKLGGRELNYSSDIDLIIFYDRDIAPLANTIEPSVFFIRLVRDLVHIMQEITADGYVFRTDLRLRPDPGSTQAAISTESAFRYYETVGQNWERAAFIKARPVAGDINAGNAFLKELEPYIWRKSLDYNAIEDIHAMKRQIHAVKGHDEIAIAGHNLKVGRGGIREIEFFAQSQQLIAGGRHPILRTRSTIEALHYLNERGWIFDKALHDLTEAYYFLRSLEHRLQMVADQQTHCLPTSEVQLKSFSYFAGYRSVEELEEAVERRLKLVAHHYAELFEEALDLKPQKISGNLVFTGGEADPATTLTLTKLGFKNPISAISTIKGWHYGRYRATRTRRAREILTQFTPAFLEALGETADPDLALSTFDHFLRELPAALQLFAMLRANPALLTLLANIMGTAPRLARILSRRRRLMDVVLDPGFLGSLPQPDELRQILKTEILTPVTYEERLDKSRVVGQEQAFLIGSGLISGTVKPREASKSYSLLAETLINIVLEAVHLEFGQTTYSKPSIIAMGKLGGKEMTSNSDLDLIVIYDAPQTSVGEASHYYARLTQRLISALSVQTAEGQLYDVDMRLRPSGKSGPLAVSLEGFLSYQHTQAWTWEHLALTRARVVTGSCELKTKLEYGIAGILQEKRDKAKIVKDVHEMQGLIAKQKTKRDIWDTKNFAGGLVDIEFIVQFLQLSHAHEQPEILDQNTQSAVQKLYKAGLLPADDANSLLEASILYQNIAHIVRLCTDSPFDPANAPAGLVEMIIKVTGANALTFLESDLKRNYSLVSSLSKRLIQV